MSLLKSFTAKPSVTKVSAIALVLAFTAGLSACAPEVGSDAWCKQMKEKPCLLYTSPSPRD